MRAVARQQSLPGFHVRPATPGDLDALMALEAAVFATDRMSRRSLRRLLTSPTAAVLVAEHRGTVAGGAVVLFRPSSIIARLYSIAVAPRDAGNGIGPALLASAEAAALARECQFLRLEVHENNQRAIARYRKAGFREFGRRQAYYQDKGDALRFEKRLAPRLKGLIHPPPYFHQTVDFTCGPACVMMARAWADRSYRPKPADEFRLWRRATTIFMSSGPGGCEPYGLAVLLQKFSLNPTVHVSRPGPYFLDTVTAADKQRVMRVTQDDFRREAKALGVVSHHTALSEAVLMPALDAGGAAIVLVSGHHMIPRGQPHWVFAFGRDGHYVLVHDPAAVRDEHGNADAPETYAVPWPHFARMSRNGRDHLSAAILLAKEKPS
jgi:ribosomal protein S18 acetylase RimI-like enzyme